MDLKEKKHISSTLLLNLLMPVFTKQTTFQVALIKLSFKIYIPQTICNSVQFYHMLGRYVREVAPIVNCFLIQTLVQIALSFIHMRNLSSSFPFLEGRMIQVNANISFLLVHTSFKTL